MPNQKRMFIRFALYMALDVTLFFLVYQMMSPRIENIWIYIIFLVVTLLLIYALYLEYQKQLLDLIQPQRLLKEREYQIHILKNELIQKDKQIHLITSFTGQGMLLLNDKKEILFMNAVFKKILQVTDSDSKNYAIWIRNQQVKDQIEETFKTKEKSILNHILYNKNIQVSAIPTTDHQQIYVLVVLDDLTEKIQLQNIKRDFFSYAGHELKTPITILKGYAELIKEQVITGNETKEVSAKMVDLADDMSSFVDDMLMLSRLETFTETPLESISFKEVILDTIQTLEEPIKKKDIKVYLDLEDASIEADKRDIEKLFKNIIENAIKYNKEQGSIWIQLKKKMNQTEIIIKDSGLGIPKDEMDRIFERFYRVNQFRRIPGTGLGLSIVKHIVNKYHGNISVESVENEFTKFIILL